MTRPRPRRARPDRMSSDAAAPTASASHPHSRSSTPHHRANHRSHHRSRLLPTDARGAESRPRTKLTLDVLGPARPAAASRRGSTLPVPAHLPSPTARAHARARDRGFMYDPVFFRVVPRPRPPSTSPSVATIYFYARAPTHRLVRYEPSSRPHVARASLSPSLARAIDASIDLPSFPSLVRSPVVERRPVARPRRRGKKRVRVPTGTSLRPRSIMASNDELRRHAAYLLAWCGAIRVSTYVLQFALGASEEANA